MLNKLNKTISGVVQTQIIVLKLYNKFYHLQQLFVNLIRKYFTQKQRRTEEITFRDIHYFNMRVKASCIVNKIF